MSAYTKIFDENDKFMARYESIKNFIKGLSAKGTRAGLDPEELESELMLKLHRIIKTFDEKRGVRFTTFAIACLSNEYKEIVSKRMAGKRSNGKMDISLESPSGISQDSKNKPCIELIVTKAGDPFDVLSTQEMVEAVKSFYARFGNERSRGMVGMSFRGIKQSIIAEKYNCRQSLVSFYVNKFKRELRIHLIEEGYID